MPKKKKRKKERKKEKGTKVRMAKRETWKLGSSSKSKALEIYGGGRPCLWGAESYSCIKLLDLRNGYFPQW